MRANASSAYVVGMDDDPILVQATRCRDAALEEARRWDDFAARYRALRTESEVAPAAAAKVRLDHCGVIRAVIGTGRISETERVAAGIIRELGRPVPTREMLSLLAARGVDVGGKDPASTLAARLSRAPTILGQRGSGWKVREEPRQTNEAADPSQPERGSAASETPDSAATRGEVEHEKITT